MIIIYIIKAVKILLKRISRPDLQLKPFLALCGLGSAHDRSTPFGQLRTCTGAKYRFLNQLLRIYHPKPVLLLDDIQPVIYIASMMERLYLGYELGQVASQLVCIVIKILL